jgi:hypothetical protein
MDISSYCMYCLAEKHEVKSLKPIYEWDSGKLAGYFCQDHYNQVAKFQWQQEQAHKEYQQRVKGFKR